VRTHKITYLRHTFACGSLMMSDVATGRNSLLRRLVVDYFLSAKLFHSFSALFLEALV
jgi:hypothetical protein